jgi:chromosomal replication initiation ATPase DnaA
MVCSSTGQSTSQLRLQLEIPVSCIYGEWLRHAGVEDACNRMALWSVHGGHLWLKSELPAGKSHLLQTIAHDHAQCARLKINTDMAKGAAWHQVQQWMRKLEAHAMWMLDVQAGVLPLPVAHALFHSLERARDLQRPLVIAWRGNVDDCPPELASRLRAMDTVMLVPPAEDNELLALLRAGASHMQWNIREQVLQSMLTYLPRRLDILLAALRELESLSFEQKQKPGPAWLKQQLIRIASESQSGLL